MKTRSAIRILVPALLLAAATVSAAYSQEPLPDDKKKALHRFDPADIFPEERQNVRGKARKPRNERPRASSVASSVVPSVPSGASENPAATERLRSLDPLPSPTPAPRASGARVNPSPAPTLEPLTRDSAPPSSLSEATPSVTPTPEATPQADAMAAVQSSGLSSAVVGADQADSGERFPLYLLIPLLGLILVALIALIIGLKKQLRTP
jgi:hypothetical protein